MPISVLVVDDSALIRSLLKEIIQADPELRLVGCAPDAFVARDLIKQHAPDVISLDVEMPRMDGLTFLDKLMKARPTPVLMISSLTERGSEATLRALELGAVDFIAKPRLGIAEGMQAYAEEIRAKLKTVARARLRRRAADAPAPPESAAPLLSTEKIIALGASTGGTEALKEVLLGLPAHSPGVVITQHMPPGFTRSFAERLDRLTRLSVSEARDGDRILPGHALVAPGDHHMEVQRSGANYVVRLNRQAQLPAPPCGPRIEQSLISGNLLRSEAVTPAQRLAALAQHACDGASHWWGRGSARISAGLMRYQGLPPAPAFGRFLTGEGEVIPLFPGIPG